MKLNKKRALFNSVLSLILCISMLLGTTFAWFTDSVTSENNIIKSGRLDAEMYWKNPGEAEWKDASTGAIFNYEYWEPGYVEAKCLKLVNAGNLAFQYRLFVVPNNDMAAGMKLAEVLDVYVSDVEIGARGDISGMTKLGTLKDLMANPNGVAAGVLLPAADKGSDHTELPAVDSDVGSVTICIALKMQESAGNEYMNQNFGDGFKVQLLATQYTYEKDSFGADYDVNAEWPEGGYTGGIPSLPGISAASGTKDVTVDDKGEVTAETTVTTNDADVKATLPIGVKMADGATSASFTKTPKTDSDSNITAGEGEQMTALDVHVGGVAADNTTPIIVDLGKVLPVGMNKGNIALYHVENGVTNEMTQVSTYGELDAHNEFYYDPATGFISVAMATFSEITMVAEESKWEGNFDYSWYAKRTGDDYTIANADQLAGFGAIVGGMAEGIDADSFAGKTVKLIADINLGYSVENHEYKIFYPIGYNSDDGKYEKTGVAITSSLKNFEGTFDGNGHTIANFYQNTWEMKGDNNYYDAALQYYRDGMGLFGKVYGGTVKNLTVRNFSSDGEYTTTGTIAAYADGATFENIAIFNCNPRVYNIGNGGIVGCVGWYAKEANLKTTFKNITVDNSNKISALWGSYDVACGGLVGQYYPTSGQTSVGTPENAGIHMENCHVAAQMDVYNDVCANYQYYAYRYAGILIGSVRENETIDGHSYPKMDGITASDCTVHFGTWNDYYYCELIDNTTASYTHDYQMSRLTEIKAIDGTTITYLDGTTGTVPASGRANYVIVDYTKGHGTENATCHHFKDGKVWNHEDAGEETVNGKTVLKEDKQHLYLEFNNLVTGYGWGVTSKGLTDFEGVENMDITEGDHENSVKKFEGKVTELANNKEYKIGDIFSFVDKGVKLVPEALTVSVTSLDEKNPVSAEFTRDTANWENGTLTLEGTGPVKITIQDYYFCTPTEITVEVKDASDIATVDRFVNKFNKDFLYRVGNENSVPLNMLFGIVEEQKDSVGSVSVNVETVAGTAFAESVKDVKLDSDTIKFTGTGVVQVTISDDNFSNSVSLYLEVINATNITRATGTTTGGDLVLLCDINSSSYVNYWNCTLYGNGFTYSLKGAPTAYNSKQGHGILITENATLDNLVIVGDVYDSYGAFSNQDNYNAAIHVKGNTTIQNCYIANCATPVKAFANTTIVNSTLWGGALANLVIVSGIVTLEDVTTVNYNDGRRAVGLGIAVHPEATDAAKLVLNGNLMQYNYLSEAAKPEDADAAELHAAMFGSQCSDYHYGTKPNRYVNAGIASMSAVFNGDDIIDNANTGYKGKGVTLRLYFQDRTGYIYSEAREDITTSDIMNNYIPENDLHKASVQGPVSPEVVFDHAKNAHEDGNDRCYEENGIVHISMDEGDTFNWDTAILSASKLGQVLPYTVSMNGVDYTGKSIAFNTAGDYTVTYTYTDTNNYCFGEDGEVTTYSQSYTQTVHISVSTVKAAWKDAEINVTETAMSGIYVRSGDYDYSYKMKFLDCVKITDYTQNGQGSPVALSQDIKSVSFADAKNNNPGKFDTNNGTITITYNSGKVLTVSIGAWSGSGPSTKTCSVKTDNGVYLITDGASNAANTNVTWKITGYSYTGNNGKTVSNNTTVTFTWNEESEGYDSKSSSGCFAPDTLITLADGSQKRVGEVVATDKILAWDFFTGTYVEKEISLLVNHGEDVYRVANLKFSDNSTLRIIAEHGVFDYDLNRFVYISVDNMHEYVGHRFVQYAADGGYDIVTLTEAVETEEYTTAWSVSSAVTSNAFASGMLTVAPPEDFYNWVEMDGKLKYDAEQFARDVETYGLYTYEDFKDYVTYEQFVAWNGAYLKVPVEKGCFTFEYILELIELYKGWMPQN